MNKLTPEMFVKWCEEVAEWNKVARNGEHDFSEQVIRNQERFVLEEVKEAIEAIETGNVAGKLEELADVLVTMSYLYFLLVGGDDECAEGLSHLLPAPFREEEEITDELEDTINILNGTIRPDFVGLVLMNVYDMLDFYERQGHNVVAIVEEVLKSNWSKIPLVEGVNPHLQCKWIEKERHKKGVTYTLVGDRVVFRDETGKITKPSCFKEANIKQYI